MATIEELSHSVPGRSVAPQLNSYTPPQVPQIVGPATAPQLGASGTSNITNSAPLYRGAPQLAAPSAIADVAASAPVASESLGPIARAAGLASRAAPIAQAALPAIAIGSAANSLGTGTDEYARRMGIDAPESTIGQLGVRAAGVMSDLGNAVTMGGADRIGNLIAGNGFNRSPSADSAASPISAIATARTPNGPTNVPVGPRGGASGDWESPPPAAATPDDASRGANMTSMQATLPEQAPPAAQSPEASQGAPTTAQIADQMKALMDAGNQPGEVLHQKPSATGLANLQQGEVPTFVMGDGREVTKANMTPEDQAALARWNGRQDQMYQLSQQTPSDAQPYQTVMTGKGNIVNRQLVPDAIMFDAMNDPSNTKGLDQYLAGQKQGLTNAAIAPTAAAAAVRGQNLDHPFAQGINQGGTAPGAEGTGSTPTGDDYLKSIPPALATQVKKIANGEMPFPTGMALKTPYWQQMLGAVSQYDPSFDAVNFNARAKTRTDFTSGKSSQNLNAMNTVAGHLQSLSDAADALNNTKYPWVNTTANFIDNNIGDPRIKKFDATKKAVVDELTRVWRGNGGSEGDIKTWASTLDASNSPEQLHGVIGQLGELIESKINAMGEQYKQGMGKSGGGIQLITPEARKTLDKLQVRAGNQPTPQATGASGDWESKSSAAEPKVSTFPQAAAAMLKANPKLRAQFEAKYGQGSAASVLGQ